MWIPLQGQKMNTLLHLKKSKQHAEILNMEKTTKLTYFSSRFNKLNTIKNVKKNLFLFEMRLSVSVRIPLFNKQLCFIYRISVGTRFLFSHAFSTSNMSTLLFFPSSIRLCITGGGSGCCPKQPDHYLGNTLQKL